MSRDRGEQLRQEGSGHEGERRDLLEQRERGPTETGRSRTGEWRDILEQRERGAIETGRTRTGRR